MEPAFIVAAFAGGLAALALRLPPMVGFLAAGFVLNALGYGLTPALGTAADLGVTLLLFSIGLKLDVRSLLRREVWGTATVHMIASTLLIAVFVGALKFTGLSLLQGTGWPTLLLLGFALSDELALAVALSFAASAPLNTAGESVYRASAPRLGRYERSDLLESDRPVDVGGARAVILGMGRVGRGAYDRLAEAHTIPAVGVEHDPATVARLRGQGYRVVEGDATDSDFWERLSLAPEVELIVLATPHQRGNLAALDQLGGKDCRARIAGVVTHEDEIAQLRERGADAVFHLYGEAGRALVDDAFTRPGT